MELKSNAQKAKVELEKQLKESELRVVKAKELEKLCETKTKRWEKKEQTYKSFINHQTEALQVIDFIDSFVNMMISYGNSLTIIELCEFCRS